MKKAGLFGILFGLSSGYVIHKIFYNKLELEYDRLRSKYISLRRKYAKIEKMKKFDIKEEDLTNCEFCNDKTCLHNLKSQ